MIDSKDGVSISLWKKNACKRKDLLEIDKTYQRENKKNINSQDFKDDWEVACQYVDKTLKLLTNLQSGFGVISKKWIPYTPMIPVIATLLKEIESRIDRPNCLEKIFMWY